MADQLVAKPNSSYSAAPPYNDSPPYHEQLYSPYPKPQQSAGATIKFPRKFIYHVKFISTTSYIGPSKEQPLFAVQTPSKLVNCFGLGQITLRNGTDKLSPPIASVGAEKGSLFRRSLIRVAPRAGAPGLEITMSGDWSRTHEFTLPLGGDAVERFEWRHSRGDEVRELSGGFNYGWKLVRLDGPVVVPGQSAWDKSYTSDGKEVVAVGAHPRFLNKSPEFAFLGAGAEGELGETFQIVAVMGFLRLYELSVQQSTINSTAAASSTSVAITA